MHLKLGSKTVIAVISTAAAISPPGTAGKYLLTTNTDVYIRFDAGTATAANFDLFLPAGGMILVEGIPYVANGINAIRATADGVLAIQEVE
jgi:hypothetical protein